MGKITIGRNDDLIVSTPIPMEQEEIISASIISEPTTPDPIIIIEKEIIKEVPVEVIKYVDREVVVEKLVEVVKQVEVPVEVFVEKEIIKEIEVPKYIETKVIDLSRTFELEQRLNKAMSWNNKLRLSLALLALALVVSLVR